MNIGDILGSLSPGFGLLTKQGAGQFLPYMSPPFLAHKLGAGMEDILPFISPMGGMMFRGKR